MAIITGDTIRMYRQVAKNITPERIDTAIHEAQELDIMPKIGADLYGIYEALGADNIELMPPMEGEQASFDCELTPEQYKMLNGGYYDDCNGRKHKIQGIKVALAYYAYARFIKANSAQVTPFGVVVKEGDDSRSASAETIAELASDARRIADQYMTENCEYWKSVSECCSRKGQGTRKRIIAIGD